MYEGLEANVMEDFVDLRIQLLDANSLKPPIQIPSCRHCQITPPQSRLERKGMKWIVRCSNCGATEVVSRKSEIGTTERLKRSKKVLFLGGAGIGKTTFQRYTILSIIQNPQKVEFLEKKERPVPFFVPLKAIENTVTFPILKYILRNNSMLDSLPQSEGIKKLLELTRNDRLFLFLDGYDEIQFTPGQQGPGFIRDELNLIMGTDALPKLQSEDSHVWDFYESLKYCRIWLSCRKEFFEQYPIRVNSKGQSKGPIVSAVEIEGIADNRQNLIKKIFEKYRGATKRFDDIFDAEYFVYELDKSSEHGLKELSYNPLFLTLMCFIYAKTALREETYDVKWASSFNDLIATCINMLLRELDEGKISELPKARRAALRHRRGEYIPEKVAFLRFFSFTLFDENRRLFNAEYLKNQAALFFQEVSDSPDRDLIIGSLTDDVLDRPHIVSQLLNTGIFILVDKVRQDALYDFPHQRFREVLAAEYFLEHGYDYLIDKLEDGRFSELLYVFFNRSNVQDHILHVIFQKLRNNSNPEFLSTLLLNCLRRKPIQYNPTHVIREFFLECLNTDSFFSFKVEVLDYFEPDAGFAQAVADRFRTSVREERYYSLLLCADLLSYFEKGIFRDHIITDLLPKFGPAGIVSAAAVLNREGITTVVKDAHLTGEQNFVFWLSDRYKLIKKENGSIPFAQKGKHPEYCYIVTDEIINDVAAQINVKFPSDNRKLSEENIKDAAKEITYKVFFKDDFLNKHSRLNTDDIKACILERSRIRYSLYCETMQTLKAIDEGTYEMRFFT